MTRRIGIRETFGLSPLPVRVREAWMALGGGAGVPRTRFDHTSLGVLHPLLSLKTWLGRVRADRRIPITNLYNHTPTPIEDGWSVRKTQVRDFRGGNLSYDSHNGTDLAVPVGTVVVAPAPGTVLRVSSEFNRGGLKLFVDHGAGLVTTMNHLARTLVSVGQRVDRGEPVALAGYSGLDGLAMFPWSVPHVHFNVWLNGDYVDPFAVPGQAPLWQDGNDPRPYADAASSAAREPCPTTPWHHGAVDEAIAACTHAPTQAELRAIKDAGARALSTLFHLNYYPTRFPPRPHLRPLIDGQFPRTGRLSLPFRALDFSGIVL